MNNRYNTHYRESDMTNIGSWTDEHRFVDAAICVQEPMNVCSYSGGASVPIPRPYRVSAPVPAFSASDMRCSSFF